jgi:hypothetical protein
MEEALEFAEYLPLSFKTESERDYLTFLWEAFEANCASGKYQFAFIAYHMLTMSFVYFKVWQIKTARKHDFEKGLIGFARNEAKLLAAKSPFDFSIENEASILRMFRLLSCDNSKIGKYEALVRDRNDSAHSNGQINFRTEQGLSAKMAEVLRIAREIEAHSRPVIEELYRDFLTRSFDPEERQYTDTLDQIREELVHANYLSQQDIAFCRAFDIAQLASHEEFGQIVTLHEALIGAYAEDEPQPAGAA